MLWTELLGHKDLAVLFLFPILSFLFYWESLWGAPVIDDTPGIFPTPQDPFNGELRKKLPGGKLETIRFHTIFRWIRWRVGRIPNQTHKQDKKQPEWIQSNLRHHRFSLFLFSGVAVALYCFLYSIFGFWTAFLATVLFMAHPCGSQTAAWISGVGYLLSAFFMLLGLNWVFLSDSLGLIQNPYGFILSLAVYAGLQWVSVEAQFGTVGACFILALFGYWPHAVVGAVVGGVASFGTLNDAVTFRRKVYIEQNMGRSTFFYFKKLIVMIKTVAYYARLSIFPKRLGLYHKFGLHYELPEIELEDKWLWSGVLMLAFMGAAFWFCALPVKLSILWFLSFVILFSNAITIHQFVTERFCWLPSIGTCLLVTYLTQDMRWFYWLILGIALMRLWAHLPTYFDPVRFYQSNIWNFPSSEMAVGNLGVMYQQQGLVGSAVDCWMIGTRMNPEYDVNWYNLHNAFKGQAMGEDQRGNRPGSVANLEIAKGYLEKAIKAKTCHFTKQWTKELGDIDKLIKRAKGPLFPIVAVLPAIFQRIEAPILAVQPTVVGT